MTKKKMIKKSLKETEINLTKIHPRKKVILKITKITKKIPNLEMTEI